MNKYFDEFWEDNKWHLGDSNKVKTDIEFGWQGCKAEALKLLKEETRTNISNKKRSWEDVLRDL